MVQNPIDLLKIQQKLKTEEYDDVDDMQKDMELLVSNARIFYKVIIFYSLDRHGISFHYAYILDRLTGISYRRMNLKSPTLQTNCWSCF